MYYSSEVLNQANELKQNFAQCNQRYQTRFPDYNLNNKLKTQLISYDQMQSENQLNSQRFFDKPFQSKKKSYKKNLK